MTRLVIAVRYLTIIPMPARAGSDDRLGAAAAWFPVVGLAIGVVLALVDRLATLLFTPLLAAILTIAVWKLVTGALHLDGLADCLDGLGGRDAAQRLTIMRDSRIGAFGVIGLVLVLLLAVAALGSIDAATRWRAVLAAPVVGRAMPPLLAWLFPAVAPGQGAEFRAGLGAGGPVAAAALALLVAAVALGARGLLGFVVAIVAVFELGRFMTRRLGGVSGDVHGASVELSEVIVLLVVTATIAAP